MCQTHLHSRQKNYWDYNKELQDAACSIAHALSRSTTATLGRGEQAESVRKIPYLLFGGRSGQFPTTPKCCAVVACYASELPAHPSAVFLKVYLKPNLFSKDLIP